MSTTHATRKPMDFDTLEIGSFITVDQLEIITSTKSGTTAHQIAILKLKSQIERALEVRFQRRMVVAQIKGGLRVLTDAERVEYQAREVQAGTRKIGEALMDMRDTDTTGFAPELRAAHEQHMLRTSRIWQALRAASKALEPAHATPLPAAVTGEA